MSTELQPLRPTEPMALVAMAIEKGFAPDTLKQLLDIAESWKKARAVEEFAADMALCQGELPAVYRSEANNYTESRYAPFESINEVCKPIWTRHGFSLFFTETESQVPGMCRIILDVMHRGGHTKRSFLELPIDGIGAKGGQPAMNAVQGKISSVVGYGRRGLVKLAFGIAEVGDDDDGRAGTEVISPEEAERIQKLIEEIGYAGDAKNMERFHDWLKKSCGAETIKEIPKVGYPAVLDNLERKKAKVKGNGNGKQKAAEPMPHETVSSEFGPEPMDQ